LIKLNNIKYNNKLNNNIIHRISNKSKLWFKYFKVSKHWWW